MNIRWVDQIAFWAINHLLSRPRYQKFDPAEFERFASQWKGRSAREFFDVESLADGRHAIIPSLESTLKSTGRHPLQLPTPAPGDWAVNNHIWVDFHLGRPVDQAPIFLIQHGWRSVSVRGYHSLCRRLNQLGVNAGVLHLPYHFSRRPPGSFNGELAITSDMARSAYALRQGVQEVCWLKNQLKQLGAPAVGLWGTSYGGWISAMAITLDAGFDGALLLEPPVDIETLFWEIPLFSNLQKELHRLKISREHVSPLFRLVTPGEHPLRIDPQRVLILGSLRDPIGNPESLRRLHEAWPGTYLEIFPYGHISYRLHVSAMERFLSILAPRLLTTKQA
jgi:pimeloyl-ACP methyl ester carboxylesterase